MTKRLSVNAKITGTVVLIVTGLVTLLSVAGYHYFASSYSAALVQEHEGVLSMAAEHLDGEVVRARQNLEVLAQYFSRTGWTRETVQRRLEDERKEISLFDGGFQLVDLQGGTLAEAPRKAAAPLPKELQPWVQRVASSGSSVIAPPYLCGGVPMVSFLVPLKDGAGRAVAVLLGRHDLRNNGGLTDVTKIKTSQGFVYIVDKTSGRILMHGNPERLLQPAGMSRFPALARAMRSEGTFTSEGTSLNGEGAFILARSLKEAPWVVGAINPTSELYAPLMRARLFFALGALVILLPGVVALWLLIRHTTAPLNWLANHVRELPGKEGDERFVTLETGDELESLAGAVNAMVEGMDQKHQVLTDNQELYRVLSEFTLEFAFWADEKGVIRFISANCLGLTGHADHEFYDDPRLLGRLIHPADRCLWDEHLRSGCSDSANTVNLRLVRKDGEVRWFNHTCHKIGGGGGPYGGSRGGSFRDITNRVLLEEELERQRQFAESLLENTSTPLFVIGDDHRILFWNRALVKLTGIPAEEMVGTSRHWAPFYETQRPTLADLVIDGKEDEVGSYYRFTHRDEGALAAEAWYANVNGKKRYLLFNAAPVLRDGRTVAAVETLSDITERADAEEALRLFSRAVDQSGSSVVITDPSGSIQYVNRKFCEVTGYAAEEALGQNPRLLKSGKLSPEVYQGLWATISKGGEWHGELHNRRKDGNFFWESTIISPIVDVHGDITHYLAVKDDITQRKEAERVLNKKQAELVLKHEQLSHLFRQVEQAKKEWEQTMDCIDDIVIMADAEGRIRRFNRAFVDFTGCSMDQLIQAGNWRNPLEAAGLKTDGFEGAKEVYHEGSGRWFSLCIYPYGERGGSVITLHDLTEIKRVSDQLVQAYQELKATHSQLLQQEKMASIGQLAAGVAHEINNPMGFISSNLGSMDKYLERVQQFLELQGSALEQSASSELLGEIAQARQKLRLDFILSDAHSLLAESREGAERVRTIVQNLKSFSRVDEAQVVHADLNECLESTINIAWNELKYKTTLIRDFGELPPVKCLPQQLNQVFLNILVNAAHAIEERGEITVTTRQEGDQVLVTIRDTGSGIPEEIKNRIFEPFFTTKKVGEGTGLGLSISYDIIKKHHGSIEVESTLGEGTTFIIRLPIEGVQE